MKNTKKFTRHCKKITLSGNIKYNHRWTDMPYSRYAGHKKRKDITRTELLDSYFMVTEWLNGPDLVLKVDDKELLVSPSEVNEDVHFVDTATGEVMLTLDFGQVVYTTDWAADTYKWGK